MPPTSTEIWVRRLRDPSPAARQDAIRQLEVIGNPEALGPLAAIFALDADPETRRLAQWAGRSIYYVTEQRITGQQKEALAAEIERQSAAAILKKVHNKKQNRR